MKAGVNRFDPDREYYFAEGCFINELSNSPDDPDLSVARVRLGPGRTTRWHRLEGISERYVLLEGTGRVEVGALAPVEVTPGDVVLIPAGERQRITNTGGDDLVFLALCTPRFVEEAYEDVNET